jgi:hypothetical protein
MSKNKNLFIKNLLKEIVSSKTLKRQISQNISKEVKIINDNTITLIIKLELFLTADMFVLNFKENLIEYLKNKYENRAYYIFYLNNLNYNSILDNELPLIKRSGEYYILNLPIEAELIYFKKNDIIEMKIILNNDDDNNISVYATNKFLSCKINLNSNQIIEINHLNKEAVLNDKKADKILKNNNKINVKLLKFYNNKIEEGFTSKINCLGEIVNFM